MKTTTNISGIYVRPEAEEIILKVESIICVSDGENEGTGEENW